jgi:hypothetical protein
MYAARMCVIFRNSAAGACGDSFRAMQDIPEFIDFCLARFAIMTHSARRARRCTHRSWAGPSWALACRVRAAVVRRPGLVALAALARARRSRSARRAPLRLDHAPHREDEDELRGARGAAVGASNPRGAGCDGTQRDHRAVAAGRAHPIAGFCHEGRQRRLHESPAAGSAPRVSPPPDRRARRLARHRDVELAGRAAGALGAHGRPRRSPEALNPDRAGRRTLGSRPGT